MEKSSIKKFATWARRELISRVSQRAALFGIDENGYGDANAESINGRVLSDTEREQRYALVKEIKEKGYREVMEAVAYTWFNRFSALRFMEVNGYLPSHVRVFSDDENQFKPQILSDAIDLQFDGLDIEKVYALKNDNREDELFKYLLITQCNALYAILPGMFQRLEDYTELLLPDHLLRAGSVIEQMVTMIPEEDWKDQVQIIGWLYQYYNSEKKDEVFAALKKNVKITKENIPAATQLFTPDWIVRYMVENSLGRLWTEGHPQTKSQFMPTKEEQDAYIADKSIEDGKWHYYLEEAEQEPQVQAQLDEIRKEYAKLNPEDIRCIDPCCGSGHILSYLFDVLIQIYESQGYNTRDAVKSIIENDLYGLDIDDRAAQLAYFSVMMKGRQYDSRFFKRNVQPHVYSIIESKAEGEISWFHLGEAETIGKKLFESFVDAKEYGSILTPDLTLEDLDLLEEKLAEADRMADYGSLTTQAAVIDLVKLLGPLIEQAKIFVQKYHVVVTNPPYMGGSNMNSALINLLKQNYSDSKSDLSTVFMEKSIQMCTKSGFVSMINIPVWMFLTSYEKLRKKINPSNTIINMVHPGRGIFGSDFGAIIFVISKGKTAKYLGSYRRLFDVQVEVKSPEAREEEFLSGKGSYLTVQEDYEKIPGTPIAYWVSIHKINTFAGEKVGDFSTVITGMTIGNNELYMRNWNEVSFNKVNIGCTSMLNCNLHEKRWFPYNKGGEYRKWYGNNFYLVDWSSSSKFNRPKTTMKEFYLRNGITWTFVSNQNLSLRYFDSGYLWDVQGSPIFADNDELIYLIAFLNTKVANSYLSLISSTVCTQAVDIQRLPLIHSESYFERISISVRDNIALSQKDWDSFETSWDFQIHPLIPKNGSYFHDWNKVDHYFDEGKEGKDVSCPLELYFKLWQGECHERFNQLKANEEELNRIFIDIYGLQDELTPEVEDKDVTVRKADLQRDIRSFISYAVGCMLGRYSLNREGLIYAGGEWDAEKYKAFPADQDNVLPICDDEYFDDDIVGRFVKFVEVVYGKDSLEENLCFIAKALLPTASSLLPRQIIRNYFMNDFYKDHCKIYQKRPIYWLFDSGKKNGFKALIYMHRYQPDTIARIRTDYVHEQQSRYRTAIQDLENRISEASTSERVKLNKQLKKLQEQADEIRLYEEKIHHLADQMISIDLDDGVKVNYAKFRDVLAKIK